MEDGQFLAEIRLFAGNYAPLGWAFCDGKVVNIVGWSNSEALFALLGTTYGGDGKTTFALPKLDPPPGSPGVRYIIATDGYFPSRP